MSDIVARATFAPTKWLDLTYRTRLDKSEPGDAFRRCGGDSSGVDKLRLSGRLYLYQFQSVQLTMTRLPPPAGGESAITFRATKSRSDCLQPNGADYRFNGYRQARPGDEPDGLGRRPMRIYEDECFIFDLRLYRRYTSINGDSGSTSILFLLTFKTIGQFGYRAL